MRQYIQTARDYIARFPTDGKIVLGSLSALAVLGFPTVGADQGKLLDKILASDGTKYELRLHKDNFNYGGKLCYLLDIKNELFHGMNHISTDLVALAGETLNDGNGTIEFCGGETVVLKDGEIVEIRQRDKIVSKDGKITETRHNHTSH